MSIIQGVSGRSLTHTARVLGAEMIAVRWSEDAPLERSFSWSLVFQYTIPLASTTAFVPGVSTHGWRLGVVVSVVGRINEVNQHRARLVHDG